MPFHRKSEIPLRSNITDTALVFEGGGTRAAYSSAFLVQLLQQGIYFDYVCGISAGASHTIDYLSRDIPRAQKSFTDLLDDPQTHGLKYFFQGKGYFNAKYLYEEIAQPDAALPLDYNTFIENPATCKIGAFDLNEGLRYFSKKDMTDLTRTLTIVRASSSMPVIMPKTVIDGHTYIDGGIGCGIPLDIAIKDGYEKFFIVMTKPRGFRMKKFNPFTLAYLKWFFRDYPKAYHTLANRAETYNATLEKAIQLEKEGKALIVYSENVTTNSVSSDASTLKDNFQKGYKQSIREVPRWKAFLAI